MNEQTICILRVVLGRCKRALDRKVTIWAGGVVPELRSRNAVIIQCQCAVRIDLMFV